MRIIRRRNTLVLVLVLAATAMVVRKVHSIQVGRLVSVGLKRAAAAEARGDLEAALEHLDLYLDRRGDDIEVLAHAVDIASNPKFLKTPEGTVRAIAMGERLLRADPNRRGFRLRLVRLLIDANQNAEARSHLDILDKSGPDDGQVEFYLGWLEERTGRFALAANLYEKARTHAPTLIEAYNRLSRVYRVRMNSPAKADATMDLPEPSGGLIEKNRTNAIAFLSRAHYRRDFKLGRSREDIDAALALDPGSLDVRLAATREATLDRDFDRARLQAVAAESLFPKEPQVYLARGAMETRAGYYASAVEALQRGRAQVPSDVELRWNLADLLVQVGRIDEAEVELKGLAEVGLNRELIDFLNADVLLHRQKWSEAAIALERSAKDLSSKTELASVARRAYLSLGRCYAELGNTDLQVAAYRRSLGIDGGGVDDRLTLEARTGIAAALVDMGQIVGAIEEYRKNLYLPGVAEETKIILARLLIFRNLQILENYRSWDEVEQLLNEAGSRPANGAEVAILKAETLVARRQIDPARKLLEKARDDHPDRPDVWVALAMLAQRQDQPAEAIKTLDEASKKLGDVHQLRIARARIIGMQSRPDAIAQLNLLVDGLEKFPPNRRRDVISSVADALAQVGDLRAALELWKRLGRDQPNDLSTRLIQFDMAVQEGNQAEIDRVIAEIRTIEGEGGSLWRYARSRVLIEAYKKTPTITILLEARDLLNRVIQNRPAWPRAPLAQAELDDIQGNPNLALKGYIRAIQLGDRSPLAVRRSVQILYRQRRYDQADQILRTMQEQLPISGDLQRIAADISIQTRDYNRALTLARKAVAKESPDYRDHIWLGQVLSILSIKATRDNRSAEITALRDEAERELNRAVELGHDKPDAWVALIQFLASIERKPEAARKVREAEAAIPPAEAPLALAQACEATGQIDRVEPLYRKALELNAEDTVAIQALANFYLRNDQVQDAVPLLNELIRLRIKSNDEAVWAKRILGMLLANQGNFRQSIRALELLGLSDGQEDEGVATQPIDDLRAKVRILSKQKIVAKRREARRLLEEILRRETPIPDDLFVYGQIFEQEANWSKARDKYQNAVSLAPTEPLYIAEFARALLRHKEVEEARRWLTQLEALKPNSPDVVEIKARVLAAQNRGVEAAALIIGDVKEKGSRVRLGADLLEELGLLEGAETLFRQIADGPGRAENRLLLAGFLGRQHRTVEALDVCDKAWESANPSDIAAACIQIVYQAEDPKAHYAKVAEQLDRALKLHPNDVALLFELANIRGLQGRVPEAERIYLDAFERNPKNVAPLANLAWLLSRQPGRGKEALEYINRAITTTRPFAPFLDTRAVIQMALREPAPAIRDLEEALAVDPVPGRQVHLAEAYLMAGKRLDAEEALKDARRMGLDVRSLHPFDRESYRVLDDQLKKK